MYRSLRMLAALAVLASASPAVAAERGAGEHVIYGIVTRVGHDAIVVRRRDGRLESIDITPARASDTTGVLYANRPVALAGAYDRAGGFHASFIRSWYGLLRGVWPVEK